MPRVPGAFLAELGLQRADHEVHPRGDDPGREIVHAGLTHRVLLRMLESAETLAPFLKLSRDAAFGLLRDLVIEEAERSAFGLVAREPEREPAEESGTVGSMTLSQLLDQAAKLTDARHGPPRAPEWAVALDGEDQRKG